MSENEDRGERLELARRRVNAASFAGATSPLLEDAVLLQEELERRTGELEQLRVQMAGVGVAALGGTSPAQRAVRGQYGWSVPYRDVLFLRLQHDLLLKAARGAAEEAEALSGGHAQATLAAWTVLADLKTRGEDPPL